MTMLPARVVFDLAGPTAEQKLKVVKVFETAPGVFDVYGEQKAHPAGQPTSTDGIVHVATIEGQLVEEKRGRRWTIGGWTVKANTSCGCGGRNALIRSFTV